MTEAQKFALDSYDTLMDAKYTYDRVVPVLEKIFEYRDKGERFTASMIGEALMGAKEYHETRLDRINWQGKKFYTRSREARSLSSVIGHVLHKLRKQKMVTYITEKDKEHPHTFEAEEYGYMLNGTPIPDIMEVDTKYGKINIKARDIDGVTRGYAKRQITRYPSIDWYSFV